MKIEYTQAGDYLLPNLELENQENHNLNKYALLKLNYLKKNKKTFYIELLMKNELNNYLFSVGIEAQEMINNLIKFAVENDKLLTEKMKEANQLEWVGKMNNYKNAAEEIVFKNLIYN